MPIGKIGLIGAGNMGSAIVRGLVTAGICQAHDIFVYDVDSRRTEELQKEGMRPIGSIREIGDQADTVLIAVKPSTVEDVLHELRSAPLSTLIISVAAGITTKAIEQVMPKYPVIRVMPNTPCMIGAGASAVTRGSAASEEHSRRAMEIMGALGYVTEVPEALMDAVTGLSGSGPAYVALLIDALASGGLRMGLPRQTALRLAAHTVLGAARMVLENEMEPTALRDMVASPGGTTIEGIMALERGAFRATVMDAVEAATKKSKELGK
ncbi:MAG: pyrroline-5-carboxylate reductase [Candidatus Latescibacterota bacterium]